MDALCTYKKDDKILKIYPDLSAQNPLEDLSLGSLVGTYKDFLARRSGVHRALHAKRKAFKADPNIAFVLDVFADCKAEKSLTTIDKSHAFCVIVDLYYLTKEDVLNHFLTLNPEMPQVINAVEGELEHYNQWRQGEVYGYRLFEAKTCETCKNTHEIELDACWGFYSIDEIFINVGMGKKSEWL